MTYTDLYLRCNSKEDVAALLSVNAEQPFESYFETDSFVVDWIGQIPATYDEEGNVTAWAEKLHFNVRLKQNTDLFSAFESIYPATPYRVFA